jgi:phage baseplate assembly protein W
MNDLFLLKSSDKLNYGDINDLIVSNHDFLLISGTQKIQQDLIKMLRTVQGSHILYPPYGSNLADIIGTRMSSSSNSTIKQEIIYAVTWVQQMNINETINIDSITSLIITPNADSYNILLTIKLTNGNILPLVYTR